MIAQEVLREEKTRDNQLVKLKDVLDIIKGNFDFIHVQMNGRSREDQMILGGTITTLELEIKKELKQLNKTNDYEREIIRENGAVNG